MKLDKKIVFITGAARNLGRAMALECAREGADVVVHYASNEAAAQEVAGEVRAMGRRALMLKADVGDYVELDAAITCCVKEFGRIDVLVNNAGLLVRSMLMMMDVGDFEKVIKTNLLGTFHGIKSASRHMISKRSGVIINVSSVAGERALIGQGAYAASKGGINMLTSVAAKELARYGIRVNGIAPGAIDTGMIKELDPGVQEKYIKDIPLGRLGAADEVARGVVFLACEQSSYMTGQTITVDGGMVC